MKAVSLRMRVYLSLWMDTESDFSLTIKADPSSHTLLHTTYSINCWLLHHAARQPFVQDIIISIITHMW